MEGSKYIILCGYALNHYACSVEYRINTDCKPREN